MPSCKHQKEDRNRAQSLCMKSALAFIAISLDSVAAQLKTNILLRGVYCYRSRMVKLSLNVYAAYT